MKYFSRRFFIAAMMLLAPAMFPTTASADHHIAGEIASHVRQFHRHLNAGEFDEMFASLAPGMNAYLTFGLLKSLPNEAIKAAVIQQYKDDYVQGYRFNLIPQYIDVSVRGECAIATFLREGTVDIGEPREVLERGTFVYVKIEDKWMIAHVHISNLQVLDDDD